jgi:hypothetical protein
MDKKKLFWVVPLAGIGAVLYRLGGIGLPFNTKFRDLGIPLCMLLFFIIVGAWNWWLLLCAVLMFGAQTSYFKKKGEDAKWINWLFVGIAFSLCMLPYTMATKLWTGFILRSCVLYFFTPIWSSWISIDWLEEGGRGAIQIITLPLLLI